MKRLIIKGACQNNLRGIDLEIEPETVCGFSGPSGAGKSSLVFDTIYSEAQRRFIETFSPYARQFLERLPRPRAKALENLPAAISVGQLNPVRNSRSTVATLSEISFAARMLFYRNSQPFCAGCNVPVQANSHTDIFRYLESEYKAGRDRAFFCIGVCIDRLKDLAQEGYRRILSDTKLVDVEEWMAQAPNHGKELLVVLDRISLKILSPKRIKEATETAFALGDGRLVVATAKYQQVEKKRSFSQKPLCPVCAKEKRPATILLFSFNSPEGACSTCSGFGRVMDIDWDLVIPDWSLSVSNGAIRPLENWQEEKEFLLSCCDKWGLDASRPWRELSQEERDAVLFGKDEWYGIKGIFDWLETKRYKAHIRILLSRYRAYNRCPSCGGARFNSEALSYRLLGLNIAQFYALSISEALKWCHSIRSEYRLDKASESLLDDLEARLELIVRAGLGYLSLDRQSRTLSGGELSRLCLAKGVSARLSQTLYCIEEPSSGLHPQDMKGVKDVIKGLRRAGNTVLMTENDPEMLQCADRVIGLGPGSGKEGGAVVWDGPPEELLKDQRLHVNDVDIDHDEGMFLEIVGARQNNLKDVSCSIPLGLVTCVCGVSGSGKSTLVEECLYRGVLRKKGLPGMRPGKMDDLLLGQEIDQVVFIDQEPVSKTPRACPGTYLKVLDPIRRLFAKTDQAKALGLGPGYFSLNVEGGRCSECQGQGFEMLDMQFLPDIMVPCPMCLGKRFSSEAMEITLRGKNICEILEMTLEEAAGFFQNDRAVVKRLESAVDLGLGHLLVGQPLNTLSAGDSQRLKIARHLGQSNRNCLFMLDEPTKGLHPDEVSRLISKIHELSMQGNTVVVVEHDLQTILSSHWIIELGPEGGDKGGHLLFQGPPGKLLNRATPTANSVKNADRGIDLEERDVADAGVGRKECRVNNNVISIRGARHHNLKDVNLDIPKNKLVVITGVSGSGKSSLAFDIVHKEAQRRYLESLPSYMKQFVRLHERPDVDVISGLSPSVAIEQRASRGSSMSTVATLSEISHYLRLLYAHCSTPVCRECGKAMSQTSKAEIQNILMDLLQEETITIGAPRIKHRKGWHRHEIEQGFRQGADFMLVDGKLYGKGQKIPLSRYKEHTVSWLWGPFNKTSAKQLSKIVDKSLEAGKSTIFCLTENGDRKWLSQRYFCKDCQRSVDEPDPLAFSFHTKVGRCPQCLGKGRDDQAGQCHECGGSRVNKKALVWHIDDMDIATLLSKEINELIQIMEEWRPGLGLPRHRQGLFSFLADQIETRLKMMQELGLGYLSLDRAGDTLSGGEAQRINLCAQTASGLTGITVVLDEPTIGLHPIDNKRLIGTLKRLTSNENSVIVVEHDEDTISNADYVIDLGPGGGSQGGEVVFSGPVKELFKSCQSKTALGLAQPRPKVKKSRRLGKSLGFIRLRGVKKNNLCDINVDIPIGAVTVVTGVSGSGKTSLQEALLSALKGDESSGVASVDYDYELKGFLHIDHSPIGRTPRSCPATFLGILSHIRQLFSQTPGARVKGFSPSHFSFNTNDGACPHCKGQGQVKQKLGIFPDVYIRCQVCMGKRFRQEVLSVMWKSKDISQVLAMTVSDALEFFRPIPHIRRGLDVMKRLGLGYLQLGQPSPTLSGGEAQRLKIAKELAKGSGGGRLYLLDEPSVGLHMEDVGRLSDCLARLAESGNTVFVIEHNLPMISRADWVIDLGPGGGRNGGKVLFQGPLYDFINSGAKSVTLECLKDFARSGSD